MENDNIHDIVKSAYLQLVLSVYLDEVIDNSGVDIDSIWHCFVREEQLFLHVFIAALFHFVVVREAI